jgi:hypothetical protein
MPEALVCRLLAYHPDAGFAVDPVGVLAVSESEWAFELVPTEGAEGWVRRLGAGATVDRNVVRSWQRQANGVSWGLDVRTTTFDGTAKGLHSVVPAAFEELLVERALIREELP